MSRLSSILALALAAAGLQVPLAASPASADPGCAPLGTPACTILRPIAAPAHRRVEASAPSCVVTVGGLGSSPIDGFFDPLLAGARTAEDGRGIVTIRFGYDRSDRHPYDTYGAIDVSAAHLRSLVRDLEDECFAIDVVAHSMGGAVVDRAFSMGMSSRDGVRTYLPLASPHNGSFAARALRLGVELDDTFASAASAIARATGWHDPTSAAVGDLAEHRAPRPPRGVETVRQRLVTDLTVLRRDSVDRRYDVREYLVGSLAELEGHGGIARNEHVRDVVARTLRAHAVPPDGRPPQQRTAASYAASPTPLSAPRWGRRPARPSTTSARAIRARRRPTSSSPPERSRRASRQECPTRPSC